MGFDLSIVVPVFNEEDTIKELYGRICRILERDEWSFEILFINDGSSDKSGDITDALADSDKRVKVIHFRTNYGKSAALDIGFRSAEGRFIITMDADMQDDPDEIPKLIARLEDGFDCVSGWKKKRNDPITKTLPSKVFNAVARKVSGFDIHDINCGFKAYRREAVEDLPVYGELHRYIPVLLKWRGYTIGEIPVVHHPRRFGKSKYGFRRNFKGFFDLLTVLINTRYRTRPLHLFGFTGMFFGFTGFLILVYLSILWFMGKGPIGTRPLFLGVLLVLFGGQLLSTGLIGELITRNSPDHNRDYYITRTVNFQDGPAAGIDLQSGPGRTSEST